MKDWYLITPNTRPNITGGFENETFVDYKEDAMFEALDTDLADTVILYNYDLSESKKIRCIIQDNVSNTQEKSMDRNILAPVGTLKAGNYIFFEDEYWIITGRPGNNKMYEKATMSLCQYFLRWQNKKGEIIERWANYTSASKYDVGESGNSTITLTSNNYTVITPNDPECFDLEGKRVFIDLHPTNPTRVFKLTRTDDPLYHYHSHGGVLSFIVAKTELNPEKDNKELRICDYIPTTSLPPSTDSDNPSTELPDETTVSFTISNKGSDSILAGGNYKKFYITDSDGIINTEEPVEWTVTTLPEQEKYIVYETLSDNSIRIKALYDSSVIGTEILLTAVILGNKISKYVEIGGGI